VSSLRVFTLLFFSFSTIAPKWSHANFIFVLLLFSYCWHIFVFIYWLIGHWKDYSHSDTCNWLIFYCYCDCVFEIWCHVYNKSAAALSCGFALYMMYSVVGLYMTWRLSLWVAGTLCIMRWRFPKRTLFCYIIVCIGFHGYFKKMHLLKKKHILTRCNFCCFFSIKSWHCVFL
jgi:hypothetical protein